MGRSPRSLSSKRVTAFAAAAFGAVVAAAFVIRRRASPQPVRSPSASSLRPGAVYTPEPTGSRPPNGGIRSEERPPDALRAAADVAGRPLVADEDDVVPRVTGDESVGSEAGAEAANGKDVDQPAPEPGSEAPEPRLSLPASRGNRARRAAGGVVLVVAVSAVLWLIARDTEDDRPEVTRVDVSATTSRDPTTTGNADASPQEAFDRAADRLVSAGSFRYVGTTTAIDVSHVRPGLWLAVDLRVEGEVVTSTGRVHEIATDDSGRAIETVTEGPVVWSRLATSREALGDATYLPITEESGVQGEKGAALLPTWLELTVDRQDAGTDHRGQRVLRAILPASALGEIVDGRPAGDAEVVLTLDAAGDPVRVQLTSVPSGPPLRRAMDLIEIGEPIAIDLPADRPAQ
jgi:hypothetical protein